MENRIDRKNDESLYQPKIHSERVRALYELKQATGKPMTVLLDQAIEEMAERHGSIYSLQDTELVLEKVDEETWEEIKEYQSFLDELDRQRWLEKLKKLRNNE